MAPALSEPLTPNTVLAHLRSRRADIERDQHLRIIGLVGSFARGEAGPESDIDILVEPLEKASYFDVGGVTYRLGEELGRRVDLVLQSGLRRNVRERVENDLLAL